MNLTFAANLTKMIDAGLGREAAPPETFVAVGRTTEYTDLGPVPIASFETNVEAALRALTVTMEPIQDLHGMAYPYLAGTTLNLIPDGTNTENGYVANTHLNADGTTTADGNTYTSEYFPVTEGETYTWSCTTDANVSSLCFYDANKTYISGVQASYELPKTMIAPVGAAYARSTQLKLTSSGNCFQLELGSTATTPMYYSNICPIEGSTNVSVFRREINLFDGEMEDGDISESTGQNSGTSTSRQRSKNYIPINSAIGTVYFYTPGHSGNFRVYYYDALKRYLTYNSVNANRVFTLPSSIADRVEYIRFRFSNAAIADDAYISINYPSTETGYIPYQGQTVTIPLGQTVYGGTVDVTTGEMVVDRAIVDMGSIEWIRQTNNTIAWFAKNMSLESEPIKPSTSATDHTSIQLSSYAYNGYGIVASLQNNKAIINGSVVYIRDDSCATAADFITKNTGQQMCYELATPITVTLTQEQITTLIGANNVWSDGGDVSLTYGTVKYTEGY